MQKEKFSHHREISRVVLDHDIFLDLVLNLDQKPLLHGSPGKYKFCLKGSTTTSLKEADDKSQIIATFIVSQPTNSIDLSSRYQKMFTKIQISKGISHYLHPETLVEFQKMCLLFQKFIFPYRRAKKARLGYPEDLFSFIIIDTFKGLVNGKITSLCLKNKS